MANLQNHLTVTLYNREGDYIPRIAAVHDLCGYGKCSLGVAIPVLSAAGCDVRPVPTGLFSSHTAFHSLHAARYGRPVLLMPARSGYGGQNPV